MLPRIPKSARIAVADALAQRITAAVSNGTPEAWSALLCLAYTVLRVHNRNHLKWKKGSLTSEIRKQIAALENDNNDDIADIQQNKRTHDASTTEEGAAKDMARRVASKMADGDVRGALRIITSDDSFAHPTDEVIASIANKHPGPPSDIREPCPPATDAAALIATEGDVLRAIKSFPPSSSAGLDGIRPAHLRSLVARSVSEAGARLLTALTALTNLALSGRIPEFATQAFFGASLIALRKKGGGLRPIAIGSTYRRIAAKVAVSKVSASIGEELRPAQLGVATSNGCEAAVHAIRAYVTDASSSHQHTVLLKLDVSNAFNTVRRDTMLECARRRLPSIYPLIWQAYRCDSPLYIGDAKIWSRTGIQQGDPLSSLLFSVAIEDASREAGTDINTWYLDDATIGGSLGQVTDAIPRVLRQLEERGLQVNSSKCEAVCLGSDTHSWQSDALTELQSLLPNIRLVHADDMQLLGAPICRHQTRVDLTRGAEMVEKLVDRVQKLEEPHQAFFLLKNFISAPRLLYILRSSPAYTHPDLLLRIDESVRCGVTKITNVSLSDDAWRQATLPVGLGGLGIRAVRDLALPAYLASLRSSAPLAKAVYSLASPCIERLWTSALEEWARDIGHEPPEESQQCQQRAWDYTAAAAAADQLLQSSTRDFDRARLRAAAQPHSGAWLNSLPIASLGTLLDRETLRIAVALRVGAPACAPHRCRCGANVDSWGLHALSCQLSAGRLPRHAALNDVVKRALHSAGIPSVLEPAGLDRGDGRRPDGLTTFPYAKGKCLIWDSTCVDTYAGYIISKSAAKAGAAAEAADSRKRNRYSELGRRYIFQPVAVETSGALSQSTLDFLKDLGRRITYESGDTRDMEYLLQRISLAVVRGNATSLRMGVIHGSESDGGKSDMDDTDGGHHYVPSDGNNSDCNSRHTDTSNSDNVTSVSAGGGAVRYSESEELLTSADLLNLGQQSQHVEPGPHPERLSAADQLTEYRQMYIEMRREVNHNRDIMADPELARYFTR